MQGWVFVGAALVDVDVWQAVELEVLLPQDWVGKEPLEPWRREILVEVVELLCVELPDMMEPFTSAKVVARMATEPDWLVVVE